MKLSRFIGGRPFGNSVGFSTNNPEDKDDENTKKIILALKAIEESDLYDNIPSYEELSSSMVNTKDDSVSKEEASNAYENYDKMWADCMKRINDPDIQLLLQSMGQSFIDDKTYGWQYSMKNVAMIKAAKEDATFVQTRRQWKEKYNRDVRDGATKIIIDVPNLVDQKASDSAKRKVFKQAGFRAPKTLQNISTQQKDFIDISARDKEHLGFKAMAVFDVSDTELINPNGVDKWAEEVGFVNNLTGRLNKPALAQKAEMNNISDEEAAKLFDSEVGNPIKLHNALVKGIEGNEKLKNIPHERKIKHDNVNNEKLALDSFEKNVESLADYLIQTDCKIARNENRINSVETTLIAVLLLCKLKPRKVGNGINDKILSEESYFELRNVINKIIDLINKNYRDMNESRKIQINEIEKLSSVKQLLDLLGISIEDVRNKDENNDEIREERKMIKEEFFNFFNRINKQYF